MSQSAAAKASRAQFRSFINTPAIVTKLEDIIRDGDDSIKQAILSDAPLYLNFDSGQKWDDFVNVGLQLADPQSHTRNIFDSLRTQIHANKPRKATHQEKRKFVYNIGLTHQPLAISTLIREYGGFENAKSILLRDHGIHLIQRKREDASDHGYVQHRPLVEEWNADTPDNAYLCSEETGFLIVEPDMSAIIVGPDLDDEGNYQIELVVLRGVPMDNPQSEQLLQHITKIILDACDSRKGIRPGHGGKMVQIGWNTGARVPTRALKVDYSGGPPKHARILGYASAFTKAKLSEKLDAEYPPLGTVRVPSGDGYKIELDDVVFDFSTASRAPPEGIATGGYEAWSHKDMAWLKWAFGWTATRLLPEDFSLPHGHGSSYVDLGLKVVVRSAPATLTAFRPEALHGTTFTGGAINFGLSFTATRRVREAYDALLENGYQVEYDVLTALRQGEKGV
ncbi:hypothetical protein K435DRAFT_854246 [Dendrothele bispora CBS 962.96]|uniref:Uncharacterized protein n=1 Tax=Dendrothele bispora (strain CBS 962.96) TaxID=1314807 RepID=A0A4S8MFV6_DENBC|nr:hypothetical protein K435DRAFT_854246 [Dendrothele bispora CBS 962.96]